MDYGEDQKRTFVKAFLGVKNAVAWVDKYLI